MNTNSIMKDLEKQIKEDVRKAVLGTLQKEVFEEVREVVQNHVQSDVYDVYSPTVYKRRSDPIGDSGQGLGDENNIVYEIENGETLVVWNMARKNPYKGGRPVNYIFGTEKTKENILQKLIIDGYSNATDDAATYQKPRPFIENANRIISKGGSEYLRLDDAFEEGLARFKIYKKSKMR